MMGVWTHDRYGAAFPTEADAERAADAAYARGRRPRPVVTYREQTVPRRAEHMPSTAYRYALAAADLFTSEHDGRTYADARERGESPNRALHRVKVERAVRDVLLPLDPSELDGSEPYADTLDAYDVDPAALARHTAAMPSNTTRADGTPVDPTVTLPDGATARVYVYGDDASTADGEECYNDDDFAAWLDDEWRFVGVSVVVDLADGRQGQADLWRIEQGDYWPGSDEADIWHVVVDVIGEAVVEAERERAERTDPPPLPLTVTTYRGADGVPVVQVDTADGTGRIRVNVNDAPVWDADPEVA